MSVARMYQRIGDAESAIALCQRFGWGGESYPRAQMECLLIQAVAHFDRGELPEAAELWSKACVIADQTGLLRPFATVAAVDIEKLESSAPTGSRAFAEFLKAVAPELFQKSFHAVVLAEREQMDLSLLVLGVGAGEMAAKLYVSTNTIKSQLRSLYKKLGAHNRSEAIVKARALQLIW